MKVYEIISASISLAISIYLYVVIRKMEKKLIQYQENEKRYKEELALYKIKSSGN